jgi:hypothetical protein
MTLPLKNFSKVGQMHFHAMFGFIHTKVHKFELSSSTEFLNDWKVWNQKSMLDSNFHEVLSSSETR